MWTWSVSPESREAGKVVQLTDDEMMVMSYAHLIGEEGIIAGELAPNTREAGVSLGRFGLLTDRYPDGHKTRSGHRVYWLSETGTERFSIMQEVAARASRGHACCEHMITLPCVCLYRSHCPQHGGMCHGTHD